MGEFPAREFWGLMRPVLMELMVSVLMTGACMLILEASVKELMALWGMGLVVCKLMGCKPGPELLLALARLLIIMNTMVWMVLRMVIMPTVANRMIQ